MSESYTRLCIGCSGASVEPNYHCKIYAFSRMPGSCSCLSLLLIFANTLALTPFPSRIGSICGSGLFWCKEDDIPWETYYSPRRSGLRVWAWRSIFLGLQIPKYVRYVAFLYSCNRSPAFPLRGCSVYKWPSNLDSSPALTSSLLEIWDIVRK